MPTARSIAHSVAWLDVTMGTLGLERRDQRQGREVGAGDQQRVGARREAGAGMRRHLLERGLRDADEFVGAVLADAQARDAGDLEAAVLEEMRLVFVHPARVGGGDRQAPGA